MPNADVIRAQRDEIKAKIEVCKAAFVTYVGEDGLPYMVAVSGSTVEEAAMDKITTDYIAAKRRNTIRNLSGMLRGHGTRVNERNNQNNVSSR